MVVMHACGTKRWIVACLENYKFSLVLFPKHPRQVSRAQVDLCLHLTIFYMHHNGQLKMQSSICGFNAAAALHRVFVTPAELFPSKFIRRVSPSTAIPIASKLYLTQRRCYASKEPPRRTDRLPHNEEITAYSVILKRDDGTLEEDLRQTAGILASLDRKKQRLVCVSLGGPGEPPICQIEDQAKAYKSQKAKQQKSKNAGTVVKTIELNWAVDGQDLAHRMEKLKEFLTKGFRVEIVMAGKKKGRKATAEEADALIAKIKETIASVEGAKESKPLEGKILGQATMYAEMKARK